MAVKLFLIYCGSCVAGLIVGSASLALWTFIIGGVLYYKSQCGNDKLSNDWSDYYRDYFDKNPPKATEAELNRFLKDNNITLYKSQNEENK